MLDLEYTCSAFCRRELEISLLGMWSQYIEIMHIELQFKVQYNSVVSNR